MLKIVVIDKYPIVRLGLSYCLHEYFEEIRVNDSPDILTYNEIKFWHMPDLIIQGFSEDANNLGLIEKIREFYPKTPIIIYDDTPHNFTKMLFVESGINGYVLKQNNVKELIACIKSVLAGNFYVSPDLLSSVSTYKREKNDVSEKKVFLTVREQQIARYLCEGMKTSTIAQKTGRKSSTISTVKRNIFKKLEVENVLDLRDVLK